MKGADSLLAAVACILLLVVPEATASARRWTHRKPVPGNRYNFGRVLGLSFLYYEAQRAGKLPANNRIKWRGDSFTNTVDKYGTNIQGGWFVSGDHVRYNMPTAFTIAVLAWSVVDFKQGYEAAGQLPYALDSIRWGADYFIKCHIKENELIAGIGNKTEDHRLWTQPETIKTPYPVFYINSTQPGSDLAGAMAAALAASSMAFKESDPEFSAKCLSHAKTIYTFAKTYLGKYILSVPIANSYNSSTMYDDLGYAAIWLHRATGEAAYLQEALDHMKQHEAKETAPWHAFDWDTNSWGASLLIAKATKDPVHLKRIQGFATAWMGGQDDVKYTPKGLAIISIWGSLRQVSNAVFLLSAFAKSGLVTPVQGDLITCFAQKQMGYILGDTGRSFVVGYGKKAPCHPHHRASSCQALPAPCSYADLDKPACNPHVLYGALVGGPGFSDNYKDDRKDYVQNEVTIDYNSGFTGVLASLVETDITRAKCKSRGLLTFPTAAAKY